MHLIRSISAFALAATLLSGCGDDVSDDGLDEPDAPSRSEQDPGDATVGVSAGEITIADDETAVTVGSTIPDDFPSEALKLPAGYELQQVQQRDAASGTQFIVLGVVRRPSADVEAELIDGHGPPDERTDDGALVLEWNDLSGNTARFTLQTNGDGDTVLTTSVFVP